MKILIRLTGLLFFVITTSTASAYETAHGKIVGIETRPWGLHIQTDFQFPGSTGISCPVNVGDTYMYDFRYDSPRNSADANIEKSILLAAFSAGKDVAFHIYECNSSESRPLIGFIIVK
jgi:hypothetical protein